MRVMASWDTPCIQDEIYGSLQASARPASLLKQLVHRHSLEGGVCKHNFILAPLLEDRHVLGNWFEREKPKWRVANLLPSAAA